MIGQRTRNVMLVTFLAIATAGVGGALLVPSDASSQRRPSRAPVPDEVPPRPNNDTECNYQDAQPWMIRANFLPLWRHEPPEKRIRERLQDKVIRYRTEQYGYFEGFGNASWNEHPPMHYAKRVEFMGLPIRVHEKIAPVLPCVEAQIRAECGGENYEPVRLSGIRDRNTYHNGQVSNHVYGIAVDVDPHRNTCCMCVAQWGDHPLCQREVDSIYERMAMPACWVHVFERFGFYWLGRDSLQDTMHFEFLGRPEYILKSAGSPPAQPSLEEVRAQASGDEASGDEASGDEASGDEASGG